MPLWFYYYIRCLATRVNLVLLHINNFLAFKCILLLQLHQLISQVAFPYRWLQLLLAASRSLELTTPPHAILVIILIYCQICDKLFGVDSLKFSTLTTARRLNGTRAVGFDTAQVAWRVIRDHF